VKTEFPPSEYPDLYQNKDGGSCGNTIRGKSSDLDATCPILAIAATSIYQMKIEINVRRQTKGLISGATADFNTDEQAQLSQDIGTSHNGGETLIHRAATQAKSVSKILGRMLKTTDRPEEVKNYSSRLNRCLTAGNFEPPWDNPSAGDKKKAKECARTAPTPPTTTD
jgi:hypothetical protein